MKSKWIVSSFVIVLLSAVTFFGLAHLDSASAADNGNEKIESLLSDQYAANGSADFIVRFAEQADLSPAYSMDWEARGEFVYNALLDTANRSQANAKAILDEQGLTYQTFIAGNDLYVFAGNQITSKGLTAMNELAALPEVSFIRATRTFSIDPSEVVNPLQHISWAGDLLANHALTTVGSSVDATTDWGITDTKANQFWTTFGLQGDGIVVANIDTGVQWNHPALDQAFKCGTNPSDPTCWSDPSNICGGSACDNNGHGTHTMGTMVADDDSSLSYIAGMAPDAQWIACKGCESSSCSDYALNACADWILAPGGSAANRPDVVNNSWGGGSGNTWYLAKVQAWVAAGIFPAFSAGNNGPSCSTLGDPGDYQEAFASAAHDINRNIAGFSSRGPSDFGHEPYTKPNVSAPGVSICSSVPTNGWSCGYSGTSMASPHSAGAVALLWSCNPALIGQIDATFQILQNNTDVAPAGTCGAPPDGQGNYTFGYGYLDVLNAGLSSCGGTLGTLEGHVTDTNGDPIAGASVTAAPAVEGDQVQAITNPDGFYSMDLLVGTYDVTASKSGYASLTVYDVVIEEATTTVRDFALNYLGGWVQIPLPPGCPDYTRYDAEYYPANGLVYILGGRGGTDGGSTFGDVYAYNPATNTCADTNANMPTPVSNYTINLVNNGSADVLCIFGGRDASGNSTLSVQCYNPMTNSADVVSYLPAAYSGYNPGAQVVVNNSVYIFGGFKGTSAPYELARTDRYNPVTKSFTQLGNLSLARSYIDAVVVDGKIYAFGGTVFDGVNLVAQTRTEVMADPGGTGTWNNAAVAELPTATAEGRAYGFDTNSAYELAGKIVIAGGGQWPTETQEVFTYDVASDTYDYSFQDLNSARRDHAGFFVPGNPARMWVFGGRTGGLDIPPYATPEYFIVHMKLTSIYIPVVFK
jgi:N-acetylneuraminic acid mutarotase